MNYPHVHSASQSISNSVLRLNIALRKYDGQDLSSRCKVNGLFLHRAELDYALPACKEEKCCRQMRRQRSTVFEYLRTVVPKIMHSQVRIHCCHLLLSASRHDLTVPLWIRACSECHTVTRCKGIIYYTIIKNESYNTNIRTTHRHLWKLEMSTAESRQKFRWLIWKYTFKQVTRAILNILPVNKKEYID